MARIRTIKPEFWTHPVMCRQADDVRLAAIATITMADDEGYFIAEPGILRGTAWPLTEDSVKAHGALTRLVEIGWIEVCEHPTHGHIGRVVNFRKHQKINRPSPSRLKAYWITEDSVNDHGTLTDRSVADQGSGSRDQGAGSEGGNAPPPPSPDKPSNAREALAKHLRRLALPATEQTIQEWADLCSGRAGCSSASDGLDFIAWSVKRGLKDGTNVQYPRQAALYADEWARKGAA